MPRRTVPELMKDSVSVCLLHLGVDVVAGVPQFGDFFRQEFNAVNRVAEDDALVDFKLRKERVQAVDLLSFLNICIELGNTAEGKLVHEVDTVGVGNVFVAESFDSDGKGGAKQTNLVSGIAHAYDLLKDRLKFR